MVAAAALLSATVGAQTTEKGPELPPSGRSRTTILPAGDLYEPPLADSREPRFHQSVVNVIGGSVASRIWLADHGETIGLVRWSRPRDGGVQVGILVAKFAQFDLRTESNDLVNADYMIGIPVTFRRGAVTGRASLYHVSSHLGDEFLLATGTARVNVSVETLDARLAREWRGWTFYGGGELAVRRSPGDLPAGALRAGVERRGFAERAATNVRDRRIQPVLAADVGALGSRGGPRLSAKGGFELSASRHGTTARRSMSVLAEYFTGPSTFGQFYRERIRYAGLALQFTL